MRQRVGGEVGDVPWLIKDSGLAALQLSTATSGVEGLHDVEVSLTRSPLSACQGSRESAASSSAACTLKALELMRQSSAPCMRQLTVEQYSTSFRKGRLKV